MGVECPDSFLVPGLAVVVAFVEFLVPGLAVVVAYVEFLVPGLAMVVAFVELLVSVVDVRGWCSRVVIGNF